MNSQSENSAKHIPQPINSKQQSHENEPIYSKKKKEKDAKSYTQEKIPNFLKLSIKIDT